MTSQPTGTSRTVATVHRGHLVVGLLLLLAAGATLLDESGLVEVTLAVLAPLALVLAGLALLLGAVAGAREPAGGERR